MTTLLSGIEEKEGDGGDRGERGGDKVGVLRRERMESELGTREEIEQEKKYKQRLNNMFVNTIVYIYSNLLCIAIFFCSISSSSVPKSEILTKSI